LIWPGEFAPLEEVKVTIIAGYRDEEPKKYRWFVAKTLQKGYEKEVCVRVHT